MKRSKMTPRILRVFETSGGWDEIAFTLEEETPPRVYHWVLDTNPIDPLLSLKQFGHEWKHSNPTMYQQRVLDREEVFCVQRLYRHLGVARTYADVCKELLK